METLNFERPTVLDAPPNCDVRTNYLHRAYVGLGSNLGDRFELLRSALARIDRHPCVNVERVSRLYETRAIGAAKGDFLNAVGELSTSLSPDEVLDFFHEIERENGRERTIHWGDRTLDLDLIWYSGCESLQCKRALVPHPEAIHRDFVLAPLVELAPHLQLRGRTVRHWLEKLEPHRHSIFRVIEREDWAGLRGPESRH